MRQRHPYRSPKRHPALAAVALVAFAPMAPLGAEPPSAGDDDAVDGEVALADE